MLCFFLLFEIHNFKVNSANNQSYLSIYNPKNDFVERKIVRPIKFGISERTDFTKIRENTPGPGAYEMKGIFEKNKR